MPSEQRNANRQKDKKKKDEIIDLMSTSIRGKGGKEQHREIEERKERDWKWAVGNMQVMLMEKWKNTNVDWQRKIWKSSKHLPYMYAHILEGQYIGALVSTFRCV